MTKLDINLVPLEVCKKAALECGKNGYTMLNIKRYSDHPEDEYLFTVVAYIQKGDFEQYVTWIFNNSTCWLGTGRYMTSMESAEKDYNEREYRC